MIISKIVGDETWAPWVKPGSDVFVADGTYEERHIPKAAQWFWHGRVYKCWWTDKMDRASQLAQYADNTCRDELIEYKNHRDRSLELSRKSGMEANFPCPVGLSYMPFQNVGIQYALDRKNTLFGDQMGLGKTIESIGVVNVLTEIEYCLVICPASLKINWKREMEKWFVRSMKIEIASSQYLPDPTTCNVVIMGYETARKFCYRPTQKDIDESKKRDSKKRQKLEEEIFVLDRDLELYRSDRFFNSEKIDVLIAEREKIIAKRDSFIKKLEDKVYENPDFNKAFAEFPWDCLIVDECHFIKNGKAARSKAVYKITSNKKLYLTGTPIANRPGEMWPIVLSLDPERWKDKWNFFHKRYCGGSTRGVTMENLPELQRTLRETVMIRRLKTEVLKELPSKVRQVIEIEADELKELLRVERETYEKGEKRREELQAKLELSKVNDNEDEYRSIVKQLKDELSAEFSELARIRSETAERKIPYLITHLENVLEQEEKIVFFCHHHSMVDGIMEHFGKIAVKLDGRVTNIEKRQEAIDSFQNDSNIKLFVGSIQAAGVGITLTASSTVVCGELDWVPGNMQQAEDRCHRIGQKDSVLVQLVVLSGSIDAKMAHTLIQKIEIIEAALDSEIEVSPESEYVDPGDHVRVDKKQVEKLAPYVSEHAKAQILEGLQLLSAVCDGARREDMAGFNKVDTSIGKQLAYQGWLSNKQALLGMKLCHKYRRQLPNTITEVVNAEIERIKSAREAEAN